MACTKVSSKTFPNMRNYISKSYTNFLNKQYSRDFSDYQDIYSSPEARASALRLNTQEVDNILRANEYTHEFTHGSVKSYDSNQLASNNPIEDTRAEASCLHTPGHMFGVFDGHGGSACAQVLSKRLFNYITACLLPHEQLLKFMSSIESTQRSFDLIESYNNKVQFVDDVKEIYKNSFHQFVNKLLKVGYKAEYDIKSAMETAFLSLDEDLSREALPQTHKNVNMKTLSVAMSGAVTCVAHIDGPNLHIANVGDCCAVLGSQTESDSWIAKKLTTEHNIYNKSEVERIIKEHPPGERGTVIKMERLLGQLAPFRAMGDFRFKWSKEIMNEYIGKHFGANSVPPNYLTPPYLTARPDITHHVLSPKDKFLVLATDGLWDMITPLQTVRLVGEHMKGKITLSPLKLPKKNMKIKEINEILLQRKEGLKTKPQDRNAATHLIRNALGGTDYGIDHNKLSQLLTLPDDVVRIFRDDITIAVIYFDSEYLRHCPS